MPGAPVDPLAISIVVIFLDTERFLREAVDSIRTQTFSNWELLLVDDGSTDGSSAIAKELADADPRITYLQHPGHENRGMSASRNLGVRHAQGEWVAFLDSDDAWTPGHLESLLAAARQHPDAEMVYGPGRYWYSWDPAAGRPDTVQNIGLDPVTGTLPTDLATYFIKHGGATPCMGAFLIRRDAFERLGGSEERFRGMFEDQAFYLKAALEARLAATPNDTLLYRRHDASACAVSARHGTVGEAHSRFLAWAREYVRSAHPANRDLLALLAREHFKARRSYGWLASVTRMARAVAPSPLRRWLRNR